MVFVDVVLDDGTTRILDNLDNSKEEKLWDSWFTGYQNGPIDSELGYVLKIINTRSSATYLNDLRQDMPIILCK